jgi:hypothetical protein
MELTVRGDFKWRNAGAALVGALLKQDVIWLPLNPRAVIHKEIFDRDSARRRR